LRAHKCRRNYYSSGRYRIGNRLLPPGFYES